MQFTIKEIRPSNPDCDKFRFVNSINLEVGEGELVAVVGQVGAGKSSLIASLLGEMIHKTGHVTLNVSILRD